MNPTAHIKFVKSISAIGAICGFLGFCFLFFVEYYWLMLIVNPGLFAFTPFLLGFYVFTPKCPECETKMFVIFTSNDFINWKCPKCDYIERTRERMPTLGSSAG